MVYNYDVFISYSTHDGEWVRTWLLPRLEEAGLRVCIDLHDFDIGAPILVNIERAMERSRKTLLVLTPNWVQSEWTIFESLLWQTDNPTGLHRRLLPLRLKWCEPPKRIAMLTYADFTIPDRWESELPRLISASRAETGTPTTSQPLAPENPFNTAGPLPEHSTSYVERQCDTELMHLLAETPLIAVHGAYEIGKSSLLVRTRMLSGRNWHVLIRDLNGMRTDNEAVFVDEFFKMVSERFGKIRTWEDLMASLQRQRSILLLDEFGALSSAVAHAFIPKLHWLAEEVGRQVRVIVALPEPMHTFLTSRELKHPKYQRYWSSVHILPLDEQGVATLLRILPEPARNIANRHQNVIMRLSLGHPRKVQCLCSHLFHHLQSGRPEEELSRIIYNSESYA